MRAIGTPLRRAFAHNDYEQPSPLWDALEHGFTAVEADVFLVDGQLLLGHGSRDVVPGRTLSSVYLEPLAGLVERRGGLYDGQSLMLLVDVKSEAGPTYAALHDVLSEYDGLLTQYRHDGTLSGPVRVVVSGHTDLALMEQQLVRYATADARIPHLEETLSPVVSMVSAKWAKHFTWLGEGPMHRREQAELDAAGRTDPRCRLHGEVLGSRPAHLAGAAHGRRRPDHRRRPAGSATVPARQRPLSQGTRPFPKPVARTPCRIYARTARSAARPVCRCRVLRVRTSQAL